MQTQIKDVIFLSDTSNLQKKYFPSLDIAKFGCSVIILLYHYFSEYGHAPVLFEEALSSYAICVALFMCISGFLFYNKLEKTEENQKTKTLISHIKRILEIYLLWSIPYLIYSISRWNFKKITFLFVINKIQFWIFNTTFSTIWFLPSLAIGIFVSFYITRRFPKWLTITVSVIFFCLGSLTMTYSFITENITWFQSIAYLINNWLGGPRGGWLFAFPLVTLGGYMVKIYKKIKPVIMLILLIISGICLLSEALILRKFVGHTGTDLLISMPFTAFFLLGVLLTIKIPYGKYCVILRNMSTLIFTSQRIFLSVLPPLFSLSLMSIKPNSYGFILVFGGTIGLSLLIIILSKKIKFLKKLF